MAVTATVQDLDLLLVRERARRQRALAGGPSLSLLEYIGEVWPIVEPATAFVSGWHLEAICEHLEAVTRGELRNLVINMPPRHMKSLAVSVFWPTWEWLTHPERRWLFASYALSLSIRDSLKCRRIIEHPRYQARWGHIFHLTSDQNVKARFENNRTGYRIATSVGGAATGEGGDRIVCDDPHAVQEAESEAKRTATLEWWDQVMATRGNDPKTVAKVIVMQRVHEADLSGHVLEQGGYEHLCLPAEYEPRTYVTGIGWSDPRTEAGALLWPERFGATELADLKRALGSYAAAGQLQQRPAPAEGGILKRGWWQFYREPPAQFDELIQSWDMAFKDTKASAYVVGQVWGRKGADKYLLDQTRDKMDFPTTLQAVRTLSAKWPAAMAKLVEDKANGSAVIATLQHELSGLIAVNPEGGKEARAHAVSPQIEAGNVYLPDPTTAPWVHDFIEECAAFPNGAYADQVDTTTQALLRLAAEPRTVPWY